MRLNIFAITTVIFLLSCGQNNNKTKELELRERELALKEKEFALKEKDTTEKINALTDKNTQIPRNGADIYQLDTLEKTPSWASNCETINIGTYGDYMAQDNPKEQIIAFIGDEDSKPIGYKTPYLDFICISLNKKLSFLKFKKKSHINDRDINEYEAGDLKIILDFDNHAPTSSGIGLGGKFKLFINEKLLNELTIWWSR